MRRTAHQTKAMMGSQGTTAARVEIIQESELMMIWPIPLTA